MATQISESRWVTDPEDLLASLPEGHPFKGMSTADFKMLALALHDALKNSPIEAAVINDSFHYTFIGHSNAWRVAGRSDWELYALLHPIIGEVRLRDGFTLGNPHWDGTFPAPTGGHHELPRDYSPGLELRLVIPDDLSTVRPRRNQHPSIHDRHVTDMVEHLRDMGIQYDPIYPPQPHSPAFQDMLDVTDTFRFVVRDDGTLVVVPWEITYLNKGNTHGYYTNGSYLTLGPNDDVVAAGTVKLQTDENGVVRGIDIQDNDPFFVTSAADDSSLLWASAAFKQYAILFPE
jgi:hypothetical protein